MELVIFSTLLGLVGSIVITLIVSARTSTALNRVEGSIDTPAPNQVIGRTIPCSGWARNLTDGQHLWLAVEANGDACFKKDEVYIDGNDHWEVTLVDDGATQQFDLSLFVVDDNAHQQIHDWLQAEPGTRSRIEGAARIARVDNLRR